MIRLQAVLRTHFVERPYDAAETPSPEHVQKNAPGLAHSH